MDKYALILPDFIEEDLDLIYEALYDYGENTAEQFVSDFLKKLEQIADHPLSCAVDTVYPVLEEKQVRKAVINKGRYLLLYRVIGLKVVVLMVECAERDYILSFEENMRLLNSAAMDT